MKKSTIESRRKRATERLEKQGMSKYEQKRVERVKQGKFDLCKEETLSQDEINEIVKNNPIETPKPCYCDNINCLHHKGIFCMAAYYNCIDRKN